MEYHPPTRAFDTLVCAIHADHEPGTADVARRIHALNPATTGLYIFKSPGHIPSTEFHEPVFDLAVLAYRTVVSIHGTLNTSQTAFVGGLDRSAVATLRKVLGSPLPPPPGLCGCNHENIANRGRSRRGVQLELPYTITAHAPARTWIASTVATLLR